MKAWTYVLPAGLWIWLARRKCERWTVRQPVEAVHVGRFSIIVNPQPSLERVVSDHVDRRQWRLWRIERAKLDAMMSGDDTSLEDGIKQAMRVIGIADQLLSKHAPFDHTKREDIAVPGSPDERPINCRNRLRDEGKPYPRSGCAVCKTGGLHGCIYERKGEQS